MTVEKVESRTLQRSQPHSLRPGLRTMGNKRNLPRMRFEMMIGFSDKHFEGEDYYLTLSSRENDKVLISGRILIILSFMKYN